MVLRDTLSLYRDHQRDAGDTLAKAYQGGAYSKVRHNAGQCFEGFAASIMEHGLRMAVWCPARSVIELVTT